MLYLANNLLNRTENTLGEFNAFAYDNKVARRKAFSTNHRSQNNTYNANGWLQNERYRDEEQKLTSSTDYWLSRLGTPNSQTTKVRTLDETDGYDDKINTQYEILTGLIKEVYGSVPASKLDILKLMENMLKYSPNNVGEMTKLEDDFNNRKKLI